jgi:hypothetical protein
VPRHTCATDTDNKTIIIKRLMNTRIHVPRHTCATDTDNNNKKEKNNKKVDEHEDTRAQTHLRQ